jgi:hypothetical protein
VKRRFYLDTSAYLASLLNEARAKFVRDTVANAEVVSSVLLVAETKRTLVRLSRTGALATESYLAVMRRVDEDVESFALYPVTHDLCSSSRMPTVSTPRTLDLLHLRTALLFHEQAPLTAFVSLDAAQMHAAMELGLPMASSRP